MGSFGGVMMGDGLRGKKTMIGKTWRGMAVAAVCAVNLSAVAAGEIKSRPDPARIAAITTMLREAPAGMGRPIGDRAAWGALAKAPGFLENVRRAEILMASPLPDWTDELYLEFSRNGNRTRWQNLEFGRRDRLAPLVLAECVENKGRFLPAIAQLIDSLCNEPTWVMPAHDGGLVNFKGKGVTIDLGSSALGWQMAQAAYMLGDKFTPVTREKIRTAVSKRVLDPFRRQFRGQEDCGFWVFGTNNWNAVCLAGVTGAALAQLPSREDRAAFVAAAELYSRNFLAGFTPDGYCSEGLGYWNFGFGHYAMLSELILQATGGQLDLLTNPSTRAPAMFAYRIEIINGISPAFADCHVDSHPSRAIMYYINRRLTLGLLEYNDFDLKAPSRRNDLAITTMLAFPNGAVAVPPVQKPAMERGLRSWFDKAGILIGRPAADSTCRMGVALKGGHNAEHHNHNDVGSYVVVLGNQDILLDPGPEVYTARTFSARRYESKLLNSFGHPVPVVAGRLQQTGRQAQAKILKAEFTDDADILQMDIASAYPVKQIQSLQRTFVYRRQGGGSLTVTDAVVFSSPQAFETAMITCGRWKQTAPGTLRIDDGNESVDVTIVAGGLAFEIVSEKIEEDAEIHPTRIGIRLTKPTTSATITVQITPGK